MLEVEKFCKSLMSITWIPPNEKLVGNACQLDFLGVAKKFNHIGGHILVNLNKTHTLGLE